MRKTLTISIIVAWHLTVFPATIVFLDWLLGNGASVNGVAVPPGSFDMDRAVSEFLTNPLILSVCLAMLLIEGGLGWIVFRIRRGPNFRLFLTSWRRICLWGVLGLPVASAVFALLSRNYTDGINFPLLWVPFTVVLVTLTTKKPYAQGHCQECGYDLTGNISGTCSECGTGFEEKVKQP